MSSDPATALSWLEQVDSSVFSSQRLKADYSLLYARALKRNGIDTNDVSLIMPAVTFYAKRKPRIKQALALMTLGQIQMNNGDNLEAFVTLTKVRQLAADLKDPAFQAELCYTTGETYSKNHLYDEALSFYNDALKYSEQGADSLNAYLASSAIGHTLNNLGRYKQADSVIMPLLKRHDILDPKTFYGIVADYAFINVAFRKNHLFGQIYS